jgi:hypothetical protein
MKIKKTVLALFLALVVAVGIVPTISASEEITYAEGYTVTVVRETSFTYRDISHIGDGMVKGGSGIEGSGVHGIINGITGEIVCSEYYPHFPGFSEGLSAAYRAEWVDSSDKIGGSYVGTWGIINAFGEVVVPFELNFVRIGKFSEGLASYSITVVENGRTNTLYGYINTSGEVVIEPQFSYTEPFFDGIARVRGRGGIGTPFFYINAGGQSTTGSTSPNSSRQFPEPGHRQIPTEYRRVFYSERTGNTVRFVEEDWISANGLVCANGDFIIPPAIYTNLFYVGSVEHSSYFWARNQETSYWEILAVTPQGGTPPVGTPFIPPVDCACGDCSDCDPPVPAPCSRCGEPQASCGCPSAPAPCTASDPCRNCADCGHLGGRFGFGRLRGADEPPAVQDALAILRQLVGLSSLIDGNEDARIAANITRPGEAGNPSVQDALQILRKLVGLPNMIDNPELRG